MRAISWIEKNTNSNVKARKQPQVEGYFFAIS